MRILKFNESSNQDFSKIDNILELVKSEGIEIKKNRIGSPVASIVLLNKDVVESERFVDMFIDVINGMIELDAIKYVVISNDSVGDDSYFERIKCIRSDWINDDLRGELYDWGICRIVLGMKTDTMFKWAPNSYR